MLLQIVLWASAGWLVLGSFATVGQIGKERKPITAGVAIVVIITTVIMVSALVTAAIALQ